MKTFILLFTLSLHAQFSPLTDIQGDDDLDLGKDIFSDFEEDIESAQVLEDERFYRYGRFYSFNVSAGATTFTGNRGLAYQDRHPTLSISVLYFLNFRVAFGMGFVFSQHFFILNDKVAGFDFDGGPGLIEVNMFRSYGSFRYYLDTSDLGTAFTYSNPYFIGRLEYWNQTSKFIDHPELANINGGAIGSSVGFGLEFPIEIRRLYFGVEILYHSINFRDKYTQIFRPDEGSEDGYEDLTGDVITAMFSYSINW